jgi:hypothetical protein
MTTRTISRAVVLDKKGQILQIDSFFFSTNTLNAVALEPACYPVDLSTTTEVGNTTGTFVLAPPATAPIQSALMTSAIAPPSKP